MSMTHIASETIAMMTTYRRSQTVTMMAGMSTRTSESQLGKSLIVAALCLLWPALAQAQGTIMPVPHQVFLTNAGAPGVNLKICTYQAGTSTPLATYSDEALTTELPNPIRTNSAGRMQNGSGTETNVYWSQASYKVVVMTAGSDATCSTGTTIYTADHVPAIPSIAAATDIEGTAGQTILAGEAVYLWTTDGEWYLADADATLSSSTAGMVGVAPSNIASGAEGSIRLQGRITGLSALSAGAKYYISATAGGVTTTPPANARFIAQADSTTSMVVGGNPGSVLLPDSDGTHSVVIKTTSDLTADRLLTLVTGDAARTVTLSGNPTLSDWFDQSVKTTNAAVSFNQFRPPQGRLTLTTATPVTTADVTAATTLYYALYGGNQITLYDGSTRWVQLPFTQLSLTMVGLTASKPYDIFIDYTAGSPVLEAVVWTNDTTRATALATQNGVYVQTGDTDSLYVGTIYIDAAGGAVTDSGTLRHVWNYYNRVPRIVRRIESTSSWTYTLATYHQANASAANQIDVVVGVAEVMLELQLYAVSSNNNANIARAIGIGEDSTTVPIATDPNLNVEGTTIAAHRLHMVAAIRRYPAVGRHFYAWLEYSDATGTTTWYSNSAGPSGLIGSIEG